MKLLTPDDVAEMTQLSRWAIYAAIDSGELRATKLRSKWRVDPVDYEAWIDANTTGPPKRRATVGYLKPIKGGAA